MRFGLMSGIKALKIHPETETEGTFWRSTIIDMDTRLRAARGIAKTDLECQRTFNFFAASRRQHLTRGLSNMQICEKFSHALVWTKIYAFQLKTWLLEIAYLSIIKTFLVSGCIRL